MPTLNIEYIFARIYYLFTGGHESVASLYDDFSVTLIILKLIWAIISFILSLWLAYYAYKVMEVRKADREELQAVLANTWTMQTGKKENEAWLRVQNSLNSDNPADWKVAIIEADMMLDSMLAAMGYKGDNLGDRLKGVEASDFVTLQNAWEAHKIRNQIAHEAGYQLTKREAQRAITLFESAFREFEYI